MLAPPTCRPLSTSPPGGAAAAAGAASDIRELGVVAELGGAQREAGVGGGGRQVGVRRRRGRGREGRLELVGVVAGLVVVVGVDGGRGEEPVRVGVGVVVVEAQGHLVDYGAALRVRQTVAMLEERGRGRAGGQDGVGVGVVGGGERPAGGVGQQGVGGGLAVGGAAVGQVGEGVHGGGDEGVRTKRAVVAVPLFAAAVVGNVRLHLSKAQRMLLLLPRRQLLLPGQVRAGREEGDGGGSVLLPDEAAAPFGPGPGL